MKLALCVALDTDGRRWIPHTADWEGHTSNTTCRTDEAAQEPEMGVTHGLVSSCLIMVCSSHETKLCGMLITYVDHV